MKYIGSKQRLAKHIVLILQKTIDDSGATYYIEPFVGGANIIDKIKCENRIGADNNEYLITLLQKVRDGWLPEKEYTEEDYKAAKKDKSLYPPEAIAFMGFGMSFGGKFFDGFARGKDKNGKSRNYFLETYRSLQKQAPNLAGIEFVHSDFRELSIPKNAENCVVYCDPPYHNREQGYKSKNFPFEEFCEWVRKLSENNHVFISEYEMPSDFECIEEWEIRMTMQHSKLGDKRVEKLFKLKK